MLFNSMEECTMRLFIAISKKLAAARKNDLVNEATELLVADATDDVDGSISTVQTRDKRLGELEILLSRRQVARAERMAGRIVWRMTHYASGAPLGDDRGFSHGHG